jgi:aryl-alcohol dehydrogenase-like predicted oxidoreductase
MNAGADQLGGSRRLGASGPVVSQIGIGCAAFTGNYGPASADEGLATLLDAIDAGIGLLDAGDFYGMGQAEALIRRALAVRDRDALTLSIKFGAMKRPDGVFCGLDTRPDAVHNFLSYSLQRLGTDHVDVYRPARLDPAVPIEETVGAMAEMVEAGYVRHLGLSEVGPETIRRAYAVHPIVDVQLEYSLLSRDIEDSILPTCRELGIGVTAYGVLSRGLLSDSDDVRRRFAQGSFRPGAPRFQGENLDRNLALVEALRGPATDLGASISQLALAWVAAQGEDIVPLIGPRHREQLADAIGGAALALDAGDLERIEAAVPRGAAAGARYPAWAAAHLDSESAAG